METPQYTLYINKTPILVQHFFQLLILSIFFYFGAVINMSLLNMKISLTIKLSIIFFLSFLTLLQMLITYSKTKKYRYNFYDNRIEFIGKKVESLPYSDIEYIKVKRNIFDIIAGTGTIVLSKKFKIRYVNDYTNIQQYIENWVRYAKQINLQ